MPYWQYRMKTSEALSLSLLVALIACMPQYSQAWMLQTRKMRPAAYCSSRGPSPTLPFFLKSATRTSYGGIFREAASARDCVRRSFGVAHTGTLACDCVSSLMLLIHDGSPLIRRSHSGGQTAYLFCGFALEAAGRSGGDEALLPLRPGAIQKERRTGSRDGFRLIRT